MASTLAFSTNPQASAQGKTGAGNISHVGIFFYPWYATPAHDGHTSHWEQNGHNPPEDLGSNFYPVNGAYSSSDIGVIESQLQQIAATGVDTIIVSWWGQGSYEDSVLSEILTSASSLNITVAAHIEPYTGRSDRTVASDYQYLRNKGVREFYIYQVQQLSTAGVSAIADMNSDDHIYGEAKDENAVRDGSFMQWAQDAHLNGIYTYDPRGFGPSDFGGICASAHAHGLACLPSVGPGWNATRATKITAVVSRDNGNVYDAQWQAALDAQADSVTITSYNEWHEGTQIEPAAAHCIPSASYCYSDYEGAYGKNGAEASYAYLARTLDWTTKAKGHPPDLSERISIISNAMRRDDPTVVNPIRALRLTRQ